MSEAWRRWEGQVIDGVFPLMRYLGSSEHSAVFLTVRSVGAPQKFAIKIIPAGAPDADPQLRQWKECTKLAHPNLNRLFECGRCELEGTPLLYVVMEFAEEDLSQILPERALTPAEAQEMLPLVLKALAYIHGSGLVHGRIKPSNIMAAGDQVKLSCDTLRPSGEMPARSGEMKVYDPPEAAGGKLSAPADVWSLGVTLAEVLTQRLPVWDRTKPAPPTLPEGISEPFQGIARRCLQLDPHQRWTVAEIAAELEPAPATKKAAASAVAIGEEKKSARWLYVLAVAAAAVMVWVAIPKSKTQAPPPVAQSAPVEQQAAPPATTAAPVTPPARAAREPKPSPVKHAQTPSVQGVSDRMPQVAVKGAVAQQVLPRVSSSARDTIEGKIKVRVRVEVDPAGNVTEARLESAGPSKYFARLSLEAARGWKFTPAQVGGQAVASEWTLRFGFRRTDTEVVPTQTSP
jgi:TonB family protein